MRVTLVLPRSLREHAGGSAVLEVEPGQATLAGVLDAVGTRHPALERRLRDERRQLRRYVNFYLDGEECRWLAGADSPVRPGTEVRIIPSVAGG
ncbi:MoaD/ThiS family protein [Saccharopolyspora sp. MS10]|uniref:MoaD/ThiS family protein n=1 Tax=Saccharopolyspora sp. MS10 TaxID=3385973 RepID=UPI00399F7F14